MELGAPTSHYFRVDLHGERADEEHEGTGSLQRGRDGCRQPKEGTVWLCSISPSRCVRQERRKGGFRERCRKDTTLKVDEYVVAWSWSTEIKCST